MLHFLLAESGLEVIPFRFQRHSSVRHQARRKKKDPSELLLDVSLHHTLISQLPNGEKRGRPDIVHFCLLSILGTPLNKAGLLRTYVHTIDDKVLFINPEIRPPRNYNRFVGLIEQLFKIGQVPPVGAPLLHIERKSLHELIEEIEPQMTILFSEGGVPTTSEALVSKLKKGEDTAVIVGGFPHGEFSSQTRKLADVNISIDAEPLDSWIVAARVISAYEEAITLSQKRLSKAK
ncbi:MAG: 16S rRNA methyltransferase [Candidatus Hodarchaeota archaeon]